MENATKALLIAGGILIAMFIISIGVILFNNYKDLGTSYEGSMQTSEIQKFNVKFTKFEGREDITIQEIVSLANYVREYNEKNGTSVAVSLNSGANLASKSSSELIDLIKTDIDNSENKPIYYCAKITQYDDGYVKSIGFWRKF